MELRSAFRCDRVFLHAETMGGKRLVFLLDTGGGANLIREQAIAACGLEPFAFPVDGADRPAVRFPECGEASPLPGSPLPLLAWTAEPDWQGADGMLGQAWFRDRVWLVDYASRRLAVSPSEPTDGWAKAPLGLARAGPTFPRIQVEVDGEALDLLFDTGATARLTPPAAAALGGPRLRGTSFVIDRVMRRWRDRHPDWRYLPAADSARYDMLEAPEVIVAGRPIGPVWFTQRPDASFTEWMSSMMDKPIAGALGGSALRHGTWLLDYPHGVVWFRGSHERDVT